MNSRSLGAGWIDKNEHGRYYQPGRRYCFTTKMEVGDVYMQLYFEKHPEKPTVTDLSKAARVGWHFANKVIQEIEIFGEVQDPEIIHGIKMSQRPKHYVLDKVDASLLLALRAECSSRPLYSYMHELFITNGTIVCVNTIRNFFQRRNRRSGIGKPIFVPIDKFKDENLVRFVDFFNALMQLPDRSKFNFLDEKHIVNKDVLPNKVRQDPLTGKTPFIAVSGDFREAYNVFACITLNPMKAHPVFYHITLNNGNAVSFMNFIDNMIVSGFFKHNEVLIMDNAAIHLGGEAKELESRLWNTVVDGQPLNVFVLFLPARAPELNPIELLFHILAKRIRSFRYNQPLGLVSHAVVKRTAQVLNEIDYELILKLAGHCGYL